MSDQGHRTVGSLRRLLDVSASLAMLVASAAILWVSATSVRSRRPSVSSSSTEKPSIPLALGQLVLGEPDARVGIIEFSDFQCPFCGRFARETFPRLARAYVDSGRIQFAFRNLPLAAKHDRAYAAAVAAACAAQQSQFWPMHDLLFAEQGGLAESDFERYGLQLRLKLPEFKKCRDDGAKRVQDDIELARSLKISGTPVFFIGVKDGEGRLSVSDVIQGAQPFESFDQALTKVLARKSS